MTPRIATVILFFNKPALTAQCIKEITTQLPSNSPLYVIDNGSSLDESSKVQSSFRIPVNKGFSYGMNLGLKKAFEDGADLCAAFSNDATPGEGFYSYLEKQPINESSILCPNVYFFKDRQKLAYTHGKFHKEKTGFLSLEHLQKISIQKITPPYYYPAAVTVWSKRAFEKLSGFDERFFCYWEDVYLSYRANKEGVELISDPNLHVFHLGRATTGKKKIYSESFLRGEKIFRNELAL